VGRWNDQAMMLMISHVAAHWCCALSVDSSDES